MEDSVSAKEAIDVKKGRKRKRKKKKNPAATDGKNGGGANVKKERKRSEKAFGVWCGNTKHWVPQIPFNY